MFHVFPYSLCGQAILHVRFLIPILTLLKLEIALAVPALNEYKYKQTIQQ